MKHRVVVGFDPGTNACLVALPVESDAARIFPVRFKRGEHSGGIMLADVTPAFKAVKKEARPLLVAEAVQGRGGWSAGSNFSFGYTYGGIMLAAHSHGWDLMKVTPQNWQRYLHDPEDSKDAKTRSALAYARLFPHDPLPRNRLGKLDHNAIDALLIAYWGITHLGLPTRRWHFGKETT